MCILFRFLQTTETNSNQLKSKEGGIDDRVRGVSCGNNGQKEQCVQGRCPRPAARSVSHLPFLLCASRRASIALRPLPEHVKVMSCSQRRPSWPLGPNQVLGRSHPSGTASVSGPMSVTKGKGDRDSRYKLTCSSPVLCTSRRRVRDGEGRKSSEKGKPLGGWTNTPQVSNGVWILVIQSSKV